MSKTPSFLGASSIAKVTERRKESREEEQKEKEMRKKQRKKEREERKEGVKETEWREGRKEED